MFRDVQIGPCADRCFRWPMATLAVLGATILCGTGFYGAPRAPDLLQGDGRVSAFYAWDAAIPEPGQLLRHERLEPTLGLSQGRPAISHPL